MLQPEGPRVCRLLRRRCGSRWRSGWWWRWRSGFAQRNLSYQVQPRPTYKLPYNGLGQPCRVILDADRLLNLFELDLSNAVYLAQICKCNRHCLARRCVVAIKNINLSHILRS